MHFLLIQGFEPSKTSSGVNIASWTLIKLLQEAGHKVTLCFLGDRKGANFAEAEALGIGIEILPIAQLMPSTRIKWIIRKITRVGRLLLNPSLVDFYLLACLAPEMKKILNKCQPDAILAYTLFALATLHGIKGYPRLSLTVELDHLAHKYRCKMTPVTSNQFPRALLSWFNATRQFQAMIQMLNECDAVVNYAAQNAKYLLNHGVKHCLYIPPPIRDAGGKDWQKHREACQPRQKPKILMVGHLDGLATLTGLEFFFKKILPLLEKRLGADGFEVHIAGSFDKHAGAVRRVLQPHPSVIIRGYVEDIGCEFLSSDILFVPTPTTLGTRTRIVEGFSYGCCVISHEGNAAGIPQMIHRQNALMASDAHGLVDQVIYALQNPSLRKELGERGRKTYDEHFSPETAGTRMIVELERIACSIKHATSDYSKGGSGDDSKK